MKVNLNLKCEEFGKYLIHKVNRDFPDLLNRGVKKGISYRFKFPNGYGASVIKRYGSYGYEDNLWELAVLDQNGVITYETDITGDVEGYLTDEDVCKLLAEIKGL